VRVATTVTAQRTTTTGAPRTQVQGLYGFGRVQVEVTKGRRR
jgi:hypothetical protein